MTDRAQTLFEELVERSEDDPKQVVLEAVTNEAVDKIETILDLANNGERLKSRIKNEGMGVVVKDNFNTLEEPADLDYVSEAVIFIELDGNRYAIEFATQRGKMYSEITWQGKQITHSERSLPTNIPELLQDVQFLVESAQEYVRNYDGPSR